MKNAKDLVEEFVRELEDLGVGKYMLAVADPDSDLVMYRNGADHPWVYGTCAQYQAWFRRVWENDAEADNRKGEQDDRFS